MDIGWMMICEVIYPIIDAFVPVYIELSLLYPVDRPVKFHVEILAALLEHAPIDEAFGGCVVCLQRKGALYVPHFG